MLLRTSISDLSNAFNTTPIVELIENKTKNFMRQCLDSGYIKLQFLSICVIYGLRTLEFESEKKNRKYTHIDIMLYIVVDNHDVRY